MEKVDKTLVKNTVSYERPHAGILKIGQFTGAKTLRHDDDFH